MGLLSSQRLESIIRDNPFRPKILEFGGISTGFFCQSDKQFGTLQVAVMIRSDIGNEIGRMRQTDDMITYRNFHDLLHFPHGLSII